MIVKCRDSLLTTSSGYTNYRGILNLVIILLVLSNARAALENVIKYGILVDPLSWLLFIGEGSHWTSLLVLVGLGGHTLVALGVEKLIARATGSRRLTCAIPGESPPAEVEEQAGSLALLRAANAAMVANLSACLALPPIFVYTNETHPLSASVALTLVSVVFLKLVSYHMMNFWSRDSRLPVDRQSRTCRYFLKTYMPPAIEFADARESPAVRTAAGESRVAGESKSSDWTGPNQMQETAATGLRHRLHAINNAGGERVSTSHEAPAAETNNNNNLKDMNDDDDDDDDHDENKPPRTAASKRPRAARDGTAETKDETTAGQQERAREVARMLGEYPSNLSLRDLAAFMVYPTLCYELEFARTSRIRKRFLVKRVLELIILTQLDVALVQQWIVPTVSNSVTPLRQMQLTHMLERLLKLAVPNHVIWLIWFYLFFHSLLNILAELTRFADREFYRDWWNSESVHYFWSNWNIPVHKWCARHLYVPLISIGLSKCQASTAVFFVSAFFHEYLVSVPLKMFRMWAFAGMLMQLPWARFVSSYFNSYSANVAVWVSLIIGQPLCILMYFHDYYVINININAPAACSPAAGCIADRSPALVLA